MTLRERFEALQRYALEDNGASGDYWIDEYPEGAYLSRDDVLALVDEIERETAARTPDECISCGHATTKTFTLERTDHEKKVTNRLTSIPFCDLCASDSALMSRVADSLFAKYPTASGLPMQRDNT